MELPKQFYKVGECVIKTNEAETAIVELFVKYADDVFRYARYSLPADTDARDIVQEVFLRAFRMWDSYKHEVEAKHWLLRIARNHIYDLLRQRRKRQQILETYPLDFGKSSTTLDTLVELEDVVKQLKVNYRQVFVLRCIDDLSVADTANILQWSETKVRTTYFRAIVQIRKLIDEDMPILRGSRKEGVRIGQS